MKKTPFILALIQEEKIKLAEPSKTIADAYRKKSRNTLKAAHLLLHQDLLEEATTMAYFNMYNQAVSLLFLAGIKCKNHAATIILLKDLFHIDTTNIAHAKKERVDKQYYVDFVITQAEVEATIEKAKTFREELDAYHDTLTHKQLVELKNDFQRTYFTEA